MQNLLYKDGMVYEEESGKTIAVLYNEKYGKLLSYAPELLKKCKNMITVSEKAKNGKGYDNEPGIWIDHIKVMNDIERTIYEIEEEE